MYKIKYFALISVAVVFLCNSSQAEKSLYQKWKEWTKQHQKFEEQINQELINSIIPHKPEDDNPNLVRNISRKVLAFLFNAAPHYEQKHGFTSLQDLKGKIPKKIHQIIAHLNNPKENECEKTVVFYGPSGVGKSAFAEAIAVETKAMLIKCAGPEFITKYQGSGPENLRDVFKEANSYLEDGKKVVIFMDELDGLCDTRDNETNSTERRDAVNQLLETITELQTQEDQSIIFIGATNYKKNIDKALTKNRFEMIKVPLPDYESRVEIIQYYLNKYKHLLSSDEIEALAEKTDDFSIGELKRFIKKARQNARESGKEIVSNHDFISIFDDVQKIHEKNVKNGNRKKNMNKIEENSKKLQNNLLRIQLQEERRREWRTRKVGIVGPFKDFVIGPVCEFFLGKQKDYEREAENIINKKTNEQK